MRARLAAAAVLALAPAGAGAYEGGSGYPLSLPQTLRGTMQVPLAVPPTAPADTLAELYPVLAACWRAPAGLDRPRAEAGPVEITTRLSLRRDGRMVGPARITYVGGVGRGQRPALVRATLDGLAGCLPARITPALGRAIAGRPMALRLVYRPPA